MDNKFLQSLRTFRVKELPDNLQDKSKEELLDWIKKNCRSGDQIKRFYKATILAVQQDFADRYKEVPDIDKVVFNLLEGRAEWDSERECFIFYPDENLQRLLDETERTNSTVVVDSLEKRFYKMIKVLFRVQETPEPPKAKKDKKDNKE